MTTLAALRDAYERQIQALQVKVTELQHALKSQATFHRARYSALESQFIVSQKRRKALESIIALRRDSVLSSAKEEPLINTQNIGIPSDVGVGSSANNSDTDLEQAGESRGEEEGLGAFREAKPPHIHNTVIEKNDDSYGILSPPASISFPFSECYESKVEMYVFCYYQGTGLRTLIGAFHDEQSAQYAANKHVSEGSLGCWSRAQDIVDSGRRIARLLVWIPRWNEFACDT